MEYCFLGKTGIQVSSLCMGTMTFGREADKAASKDIFNRCRDAGINFFDCANVYSEGRAESILGELISDCRNELVINSKFGSPMGTGYNAQGGIPATPDIIFGGQLETSEDRIHRYLFPAPV